MTWRLRYSKLGKIRFTSHRDTVAHVERALRRCGVGVAYSQGFTPRPKISFGLGLPTGAESLAEYLDIDLADPIDDLDAFRGVLTDALPVGYTVTAIAPRPVGAVSLQEIVTACQWEIALDGVSADELDHAVRAGVAASVLLLDRERKGQRRTDDVRPSIETLAALEPDADDRPRLGALLATGARGLRPTELVQVLLPRHDALDAARRIVRTEQFIDVEGERRPVLAPAPTLQETHT
jgi:radical SAM-linked protein